MEEHSGCDVELEVRNRREADMGLMACFTGDGGSRMIWSMKSYHSTKDKSKVIML